MLRDFLIANRDELIGRCDAKAGSRGVPLFLDQLGEALHQRHGTSASSSAAASHEDSRTASSHGEHMHEAGFTIEQVVHDYGDVCQAITGLAREKGTPVSVGEFQILNRLLDNAIADAVSSYETSRDLQGSFDLHKLLGTLAEEQRRHLDVALKAFDALKVGNIGVMGATGTLLEDSLIRLRELIDKSHPEVRLTSGMAKPPQGERR